MNEVNVPVLDAIAVTMIIMSVTYYYGDGWLFTNKRNSELYQHQRCYILGSCVMVGTVGQQNAD